MLLQPLSLSALARVFRNLAVSELNVNVSGVNHQRYRNSVDSVFAEVLADLDKIHLSFSVVRHRVFVKLYSIYMFFRFLLGSIRYFHCLFVNSKVISRISIMLHFVVLFIVSNGMEVSFHTFSMNCFLRTDVFYIGIDIFMYSLILQMVFYCLKKLILQNFVKVG